MASDADPAREVLRARISKTLAETMTARDWERMANVNAESAHLWWDICEATAKVLEGALDDLAARTTERDQVAHERDALRAEVEKLRAAQTAPPQPLTTTETQPAPHTPGPWIVENTGTHLWIGPPRSDGSGKVADIVVSMDIARFTPEARARAIANACLIAAAPDLRAAPGCGEKVREAVRLWVEQRRLYEDDDASLADWQAVNTKARRALDALTDADLAAPALPDHVRECVEACMESDAGWVFDEMPGNAAFRRAVLAGRAARAKGGA